MIVRWARVGAQRVVTPSSPAGRAGAQDPNCGSSVAFPLLRRLRAAGLGTSGARARPRRSDDEEPCEACRSMDQPSPSTPRSPAQPEAVTPTGDRPGPAQDDDESVMMDTPETPRSNAASSPGFEAMTPAKVEQLKADGGGAGVGDTADASPDADLASALPTDQHAVERPNEATPDDSETDEQTLMKELFELPDDIQNHRPAAVDPTPKVSAMFPPVSVPQSQPPSLLPPVVGPERATQRAWSQDRPDLLADTRVSDLRLDASQRASDASAADVADELETVVASHAAPSEDPEVSSAPGTTREGGGLWWREGASNGARQPANGARGNGKGSGYRLLEDDPALD